VPSKSIKAAGIFLVSLGLTVNADVRAQGDAHNPEQNDDAPGGPSNDRVAQEHFELGREYYDRGQYEEALREFEDAYRLSRRPKLLYNLYLAYRNLGRFEPATNSLRAYLAAEPNDPRADELRERMRQMEASLRETETQQDVVDTQPARELPAYVTAPAAPPETGGAPETTPAAISADASAAAATEALAQDDQEDLRLDDPTQVEDEDKPSLVAPLILGGVGVAALVSATVLQVMANDTSDELMRLCPSKDCSMADAATDARARDLIDQGNTYVTLSYVMFAVSAVSIGVGAGLYLSDALDDDEDPTTPSTRAKLQCGLERCVGTLQGTF
jgi:tetratricopeptide (TPR) repeat protein